MPAPASSRPATRYGERIPLALVLKMHPARHSQTNLMSFGDSLSTWFCDRCGPQDDQFQDEKLASAKLLNIKSVGWPIATKRHRAHA
jgi:hypothetical protein